MGKKKEHTEQDFLDILDGLEEPPITPDDLGDCSTNTPGWKYYMKIRPLLPEWWEEFNGSLAKSGKLEYRSVIKFVKSRTKNKTEREYLYQMIGPKPELEDKKKLPVPWIGDWYKRRKNGYWVEDNHIPIQSLKKAIKENVESAQTIKASAPFLIQDLMRINRRIAQLDELFGGTPFIDDEAPTSKGNIVRFKTYTVMYNQLWKMKVKVIHEVMRVMGINPARPNEMWGMAQLAGLSGQIGASAALTGAAAASGLSLPGPDGQGINISKEAMMLAVHMAQHAKDFEFPLGPVTLEAGELTVSHEEPKSKKNGHAKTN